MAGKLDTQGWIDATRNGRAYAFFLRNETLWVRRNGQYKRILVSGIDTIAGARAWLGQSRARRKTGWTRLVPKGRECPATNQREICASVEK